MKPLPEENQLYLKVMVILNRPPVFANYFENYMVVKEVMKEMFSVIQGIEKNVAVWEHKIRCKNFLRDLRF